MIYPSAFMMSKTKTKVLFVLHMPPPLHGAGLVGQSIHDSALVGERFDCRWVNLSASARLEEIDKPSLGKFKTFLRIWKNVRREVKTFSPKYAYITPSATLMGFIKDFMLVRYLKRHGIKVAMHLHNKGFSLMSGKRLYDRMLFSFFRDVKVILLSKRLYPDISRYVRKSDIAICHNGVNLPNLKPSDKRHDPPRILFLSNLLKSKGVEDMLAVCAALKAEGKAFSCTVVGAESADYTRESLEAEIAALGLEGYVSYVGKKFGLEKENILSETDILLYPSRNDALPLVVLEGMASSLPVVATDEGGIADEVEDGVSGFVCKPRDVAAMTEAVSKLLSDRDLRVRMGREGYRKYSERFTEEVFEKRIVQVLCSIFPDS